MRSPGGVAWLTEIIAPYRISVFNEVARRLGDRFVVLFFGRTENRRSWRIPFEDMRFRYEILRGIRLQRGQYSPYFFNPGVWRALARLEPASVVIGGYHHPTSLLALLYARRHGAKALLWSESTKNDERRGARLTERYKRWFVRHCDGYIVPGTSATEYLRQYQAPAHRIFRAPNVVDNAFFRRSLAMPAGAGHREGHGRKAILYVGRVVEEKGIGDLIRAYEMVASHLCAALVIVGDGRDRARYEQCCREKRLGGVRFEGFVQQEDLATYYAHAGVCVLPTHSDTWGLVLNEAMACGLPVICSDVAGAARDLVQHGRNGYVFPKGNAEQLARCLSLVLGDEGRAALMGRESAAIIEQNYTPSFCADAIVSAVSHVDRCALEQRPEAVGIR